LGTPTPTSNRAIDRQNDLAATSELNRYWRRNSRLVALLAFIWALVTFGIGYFARELDFRLFGWPFSFWMGAQGALIVYVALVAWYARAMNQLDLSFDARRAGAFGTSGAPAGSGGAVTSVASGKVLASEPE
jgi:putative solute:sodium symporter small subunit